MQRRKLLPFGVACLLPLRAAMPLGTGTQPTEKALALVPTLQATKMGVDRAGNLWAWNAQGGELRFLSPAGEIIKRSKIAGASSVDADAAWGVAGLVEGGRVLRWERGDGQPQVNLALPGPASDVCWIAAETVALTPQTAPHRIEVWNLRQRVLTATLGKEVPIRPTVGATRLRTVLLRHDLQRQLLYSLDSFTGELQVFTRDGKVAWSASVENPERERLEEWLREVATAAKARHDAQTPAIYVLSLALAPDGAAWVVQRYDRATGSVVLVRLSPAGSLTKELANERCTSRRLAVWGDSVIFHTDPSAPGEVCSSHRKLL